MQEMKIRYGGDNTIDANTYINSLLHFTNIVEEVNKAISDEQKVEVRIKANEPGSFIVDLIVWCQDNQDGIKRIFTKENMSYAREVVKTVGEAYKVAKHLLGKKPKEIKSDGEGLQIQNVAGNFQYFDLRGANLYLKNPIIKEAIAQEFETLEMDKSVTNIELLDENDNEILSIGREDFFAMSSSGAELDLRPDERINIIGAILNISGMDWEFKKKWDFYYNGNKIPAKVVDPDFAIRVANGERFGLGDSLEVTMEITQQYDPVVDVWINKTYKIVKILNHIEKVHQGRFDL